MLCNKKVEKGQLTNISRRNNIVVDPKKEPPKTEVVVAMEEEEVTKIFNIRSCVWRLVKHLCENDKKYP